MNTSNFTYDAGLPPPLFLNIIQLNIGTAIIILNVVVIATVFRERKGILGGVHYTMLAHLAVADAILGIAYVVFAMVALANRGHVMNSSICDCLYFILTISAVASIFHLLAVTIHQFITIRYPLQHHQHITDTRVYITISSIWLFSVAVGGIILVDDHTPVATMRCPTFAIWPVWYSVFLGTIAFFLPSILLIVIYIYIFAKVRQHHKMDSAAGFRTGNKVASDVGALYHSSTFNRQKWKKEVKITAKIAFIVFIFIFSWAPFWFVGLAYVLSGKTKIPLFIAVPGIANSLYNPIIYAVRFKEFRKAYKSLFTCES